MPANGHGQNRLGYGDVIVVLGNVTAPGVQLYASASMNFRRVRSTPTAPTGTLRGTTAPLTCRYAVTHRTGPQLEASEDDPEPAAADIPAVDTDIDPGELIAAQLPQILQGHDASHRSQMRSRSHQPPRSNQDLVPGQHAHHNSMGAHGAR